MRIAELHNVAMTAAKFGKFVAQEPEKWAKEIRAAGIEAE